MSDLLPPGNMPSPNADGDDVKDFPDFFASDMWPSLWPRIIHPYTTVAARNADLAGLGTSDRSFAWVDAYQCITYWTGTAWKALGNANRVVSGMPIRGIYDAAKPVWVKNVRDNGTTDANGLISLSVTNTGILDIQPSMENAAISNGVWYIRPDLCSNAVVVLQLLDINSGAILNAAGYTVMCRIEYQS